MSIKELAKRVYEERKEVETRNIEDYVRKILEIFNASNLSVNTLLVWQVQVFKSNDVEHLQIRVSFDKEEKSSFYNVQMDNKNFPILKKLIEQLNIPSELLNDLYEYFNKNLSEYLETKKIREDTIRIKLKNEPICEKREPR